MTLRFRNIDPGEGAEWIDEPKIDRLHSTFDGSPGYRCYYKGRRAFSNYLGTISPEDFERLRTHVNAQHERRAR